MSKRLTYREQLDRARQQAAVAALREAARLAADGDYASARHLIGEAMSALNVLAFGTKDGLTPVDAA